MIKKNSKSIQGAVPVAPVAAAVPVNPSIRADFTPLGPPLTPPLGPPLTPPLGPMSPPLISFSSSGISSGGRMSECDGQGISRICW
jgi:hypothetical protein